MPNDAFIVHGRESLARGDLRVQDLHRYPVVVHALATRARRLPNDRRPHCCRAKGYTDNQRRRRTDSSCRSATSTGSLPGYLHRARSKCSVVLQIESWFCDVDM